MTQTLTATPDATFSPPRVRLDFSDTAVSPVTSVSINQQDAAGRITPVRSSDGNPFPVSGGALTVYGYEVPFGETVTFSTDISGGPTATTLLDVARPWLVHPGIPSRSLTFRQMAGSLAQETWDLDQGVFKVLGRSTPIVTTGGARVAPAGALLIGTSSQSETEALSLLLSDGAPLFLNVPPSLGWGVDSMYIAVGQVQVARPNPILVGAWRSLSLPYQVVARPAGGTRSGLLWSDVATKYPTWANLAATKMTWAQLAAQMP